MAKTNSHYTHQTENMTKLSGRFCKKRHGQESASSQNLTVPKIFLQEAQSHNYKTGITSFLGGEIASEPAR